MLYKYDRTDPWLKLTRAFCADGTDLRLKLTRVFFCADITDPRLKPTRVSMQTELTHDLKN